MKMIKHTLSFDVKVTQSSQIQKGKIKDRKFGKSGKQIILTFKTLRKIHSKLQKEIQDL